MTDKTSAPKASTTKATTATAAAPEFQFDDGLEIPPARKPATTDLTRKLQAMPVGKSFLEAVTVPDSVVGAEREKVFTELSRKVANRLSGAARRFTKANPAYAFEIRTVRDDKLGHGVRIWRKEAPAA